MGAFVFLLLLYLFGLQVRTTLAAPETTFYPFQDRIMANEEQIRLSHPPRFIDCRPEGDSCSIVLNVTYMQTMTVYEYESLVDVGVGGRRGDDGYALTIAPNGTLVIRFGAPTYPIKEFLYPILTDGQRRTVIAINNQVPGPTIIGNRNQRLEVTVVNNLATETLAIHWHGQHVLNTPWMDGVAQLTQCPITSYTNFTYQFTLDQVGTHWYHAHNGGQRSDGLFGALIVTSSTEFQGTDVDPSIFVDLPEQHTLTFIDWQKSGSISIFETITSGARFPDPANSTQEYLPTLTYGGTPSAPLPFESGLINGAGWKYTASSPCSPENNQNTPLAVFNVEQGKTYRFRLIGAQNSFAYRFSIQGHSMTLLESDGVPVKESNSTTNLDYIVVYSGERYDVLVQATLPSPSISTGNYWMIAETLESPDELKQRAYCTNGHRAYALLHYRLKNYPLWPPSDTIYDPVNNPKCTTASPCFALNCPFEQFPSQYNITCVDLNNVQLRAPQPIPDTDVSESVFLNFGFWGIGTVLGSSINGRHFLFPPSPVTTQYSSLSSSNWKDQFCGYPRPYSEIRGRRCTNMYTVSTQTVELVLLNYANPAPLFAMQPHPVHLHGHHFRVVKIGYANCSDPNNCVNPDIVCGNKYCDAGVSWTKGTRPFNVSNTKAATKDTIAIPAGGYVVLRFERNNPGWWFLHCHIEPHQLEGMALVIDESAGMPSVPSGFPQCGNYLTSSTQKDPYWYATIGLGCFSGTLLLILGCITFCCCRYRYGNRRYNQLQHQEDHNAQ